MDVSESILTSISTVQSQPKEPKKTKKIRAKKVTWSYDETIALIYAMGTDDVQKKMEGMVHNHKIWKAVSEKLDGKHTAEQCHDKWTYLKRRYREVRKHNSSSGRGRQTFMFFDEMDNVLGHRPMSGVDNHAHLDSSSLAHNDDDDDNNSDHPEDADDSISSRGSINEESLVEDGDDEDVEKLQASTSKQPPKKMKMKVKKSRGVPGALDDAMSSLTRLQDKLDEREERRLLAAEEREDRKMKERQETDDRFRRWEHEQEERRIKENREFMLQMVQLLRQPVYQPNHANGWNGPSYTSL